MRYAVVIENKVQNVIEYDGFSPYPLRHLLVLDPEARARIGGVCTDGCFCDPEVPVDPVTQAPEEPVKVAERTLSGALVREYQEPAAQQEVQPHGLAPSYWAILGVSVLSALVSSLFWVLLLL